MLSASPLLEKEKGNKIPRYPHTRTKNTSSGPYSTEEKEINTYQKSIRQRRMQQQQQQELSTTNA